MKEKKKRPFQVGDIVKYKGHKYKIVALCGSGESILYAWPDGLTMEGTNRIALKKELCELI